MYGAAGNRDRRRQRVIFFLEKDIPVLQAYLEERQKIAKSAKTDEEKKNANIAVEHFRRKLHTAQRDLANTKANLGKGTSAMKKVKA